MAFEAQVFVCPLRVRRKVAETMPMAQLFLPGQVARSGLLDMYKQKSMADSWHHTQALHGGFNFYSEWKVYMLHGATQSLGDVDGSQTAVLESELNYLHHI